MAKFNADEIASVIQGEIEQFQAEVTRTEVGRVLEVGDGIARIYGLSGAMAGEMVEFHERRHGPGLQPRRSSIGVIILGDYRTSTKATRSSRPASCWACPSAKR